MGSLSIEIDTFEIECPLCKAKILSSSQFCGKCGNSISKTDKDTYKTDFRDSHSNNPTVWQWVSPALKLWVFLLITIGVFGITSRILKITSPFFFLSFHLLTAFIILIVCFKSKNQLKPLFINFRFLRVQSIFEVLGAIIFIYCFMSFYIKLVSLIGIENLSLLTYFRELNWPLWSVFIIMCLFPGIFEEFAFRGYIMNRLEKVGTSKEALIIQAAMFSVLHLLPHVFISHFIIGLILGFIRIRSQSIYPGIFIHVVWNSIIIFGRVL